MFFAVNTLILVVNYYKTIWLSTIIKVIRVGNIMINLHIVNILINVILHLLFGIWSN